MTFGCSVFPFWLFFFLRRNKELIIHKDANFAQTYGSLFYGLRTDQAKAGSALLYNLVFLLRRIVFAATMIFLTEYPLFQVYSLIIQSVGSMIYLVNVAPFEARGLNRLELFNEFCIYIACYPTLLYSGFVESTDES